MTKEMLVVCIAATIALTIIWVIISKILVDRVFELIAIIRR